MTRPDTLEPIPYSYYVPGDRVLSPGAGHIYVIKSYPMCRLYYDPDARFKFQPNLFELRPIKRKDKQGRFLTNDKNERLDGNFLSYLAVLEGGTMIVELTVNDYFKPYGKKTSKRGVHGRPRLDSKVGDRPKQARKRGKADAIPEG
jgi:hypothetical protein